jgi:hypothetical protein
LDIVDGRVLAERMDDTSAIDTSLTVDRCPQRGMF